MKWFKINQIPPSIGEEYLVCSDDDTYALATYTKCGWIPFAGPSFKVIGFEVSHFIALPKLPNRKKGEFTPP